MQHSRYPEGVHGAKGKDLSVDQANPMGRRGCGERVGGQNNLCRGIHEEQVHSRKPAEDLADVIRRDFTSFRKDPDRWSHAQSKDRQDAPPDFVLLGVEASSSQSVRYGLYAIRQWHPDPPVHGGGVI
ncbi:MAG: hypothetical protein ACREIE_08665 [Nitrospiraceae bacterium]